MRIAIMGAGALGSILGGYFAEAGHAVTLLGRPAHVEAIRRNGLRIEGVRGPRLVRTLAAASDPRAVEAADLLIVAVKSFDTAAALDDLRHLRGQVGAALSLQNGGGKDEALAEAVGAAAVVGAATMIGGAMPEPGRVLHTGEGMTWIGEFDGSPSARVEAIAGLFRSADLRLEVRPDIRSAIWCKLHQFVPAAALSCLTRRSLHEIYLSPDLAAVFVAISRELAGLAERLAVPLADFQGFPVKTLCGQPDTAAIEGIRERGHAMRERGMTGVRISTLQDLERHKRTEIEETIGYVVRLASGCGVAMPTLGLCYQILRGMEMRPDNGQWTMGNG